MGNTILGDFFVSVREAKERLISVFWLKDYEKLIEDELVKCKAYSVDTDPKAKAKWNMWFRGGVDITYTCNNCGYPSEERTCYCPNCGAEMSQDGRR